MRTNLNKGVSDGIDSPTSYLNRLLLPSKQLLAFR
ncbi:MAG: hypothetical protein ACI9J3_004038, partial [Parvicellaceae bacterium]